MWAHMVRMASVWGEVRVFVSRCTDGQIKAPWHSDSEYAQINAQLLDMETTIPSFYRYDVAKFPERDEAEIVEKKAFWLPWVRLQITYHTIHSVINHPFLYSSKASMPRPGANAFWRTSSELALLHSTWIARLIGMATNKGLELADPFFAHSAAVAATLHSYWARASDGRIRGPAVRNLQLCRSFISDIGAHWRLCRSIVSVTTTTRTMLTDIDSGRHTGPVDQPRPSHCPATTGSIHEHYDKHRADAEDPGLCGTSRLFILGRRTVPFRLRGTRTIPTC